MNFFDNYIFYDGGNLISLYFDIFLFMYVRIVKF